MNFEEDLADNLKVAGVLNETEHAQIIAHNRNNLFSVGFELRTLLYCGVLLATTGFGIVIYRNIDTIGHDAIIAFIALLCASCFIYCFSHRSPYSNNHVESPNAFFDYVLLSGCLLFLTLEGYLQYQHRIFGERYGLATIIPALLFFALAYLFDHKGVLSMAITALCAWIGITVTPLDLLSKNDFAGEHFIYAALATGAVFIAVAYYSNEQEIKKHFSFTWLNFAANLLFIATLSGLFSNDWNLLYLLVLAALVFYFIRYARSKNSFYFLLIAVIYGYIGVTYELFHWLDRAGLLAAFSMLGLIYFVVSCILIIKFLKDYKKILKTDVSVQ